MDQETKFARMVALLMVDSSARKELLDTPEALLDRMEVEPEQLRRPRDAGAISRGRELLSRAALNDTDSPLVALKKLGATAPEAFGDDYSVEVSPFGFVLAERPSLESMDWTATGTTKCTWDPWDGCSPDVDW